MLHSTTTAIRFDAGGAHARQLVAQGARADAEAFCHALAAAGLAPQRIEYQFVFGRRQRRRPGPHAAARGRDADAAWRSRRRRSCAASRRAPSCSKEMCSAPTTAPSHSTSARCMTFSSSRTLPGQSCASRRCAGRGVERRNALSRPAVAGQQPHRQRQHVGAPPAQWRQRQRKYVQSVVQVFAKPSGGDILAQAPVGGRQHAHVERQRQRARRAARPRAPAVRAAAWPAATAASRRSRRAASVPPCACSNLPACAACAPVKAPRSQPNSIASSMCSGMAAQLTATKSPCRALRMAVDVARQHFLAGAGFAGDQHRALAARQRAAPAPAAARTASAQATGSQVSLGVGIASSAA